MTAALPPGHSLALAAAAAAGPRTLQPAAVPPAISRPPQARTASGVFAPPPIPAASGDVGQLVACLRSVFEHAGLGNELTAQVRTRGSGAAARSLLAVYDMDSLAAGDNTNGGVKSRVTVSMTPALHSLLSARAEAQGRARTRASAAAPPARARSVHTATRPLRAR